MLRYKEWMSYRFDDGALLAPKKNKNSVFKLEFSKNIDCKEMDYFSALEYNARTVAENFPQPFDVLLSGGIDSEIVVRINHKLGIKQKVHTFRLENDYNIKDVESAKMICSDLNINLNVIDWNLQRWIENDAESMYKKTFSPLIERMVRFAWFEYFDDVVVMGEGEPYWKRDLGSDYQQKSNWHLHWTEDYFMSSIYANLIGKTVIGEWYNYTPEIVKSFHKLPIMKKLLNDEITGKQSSWSLRTGIHKVIFPKIKPKLKLVGYEGLNYPFTKPEFMTTFQKEIIGDTSNYGYKFHEQDLNNMNCGIKVGEGCWVRYQ